MRIIETDSLKPKIVGMIKRAVINIVPSAIGAMKDARDKESGEQSKFALSMCLDNSMVAKAENLPVCQDTGLAVFIVEIGQDVFLKGSYINDVLNSAVREAYESGYFRKSVCDPLTRKNTGDNTPCALHTEIVKGDNLKIYFMPKGFGSENMSRIFMLSPSAETKGIISSIVETVRLAGSNPCPPVYVGVGIGGTFDSCAYLAKKALLREVGKINERADLALVERESLDLINRLNIGAQGFKGETTAIGVSALAAPTHIAGLPVAVNIQCHCVRFEVLEI